MRPCMIKFGMVMWFVPFVFFYACTTQTDSVNAAAEKLIMDEYSSKIEKIRGEWTTLWQPYHEEKDRKKKNNLFQNIKLYFEIYAKNNCPTYILYTIRLQPRKM